MKIKNARLKAELTQSKLAELTNIPVRTIRGYEQGTRKIDNANVNLVVKLANTLNCKLEDILENAKNVDMLKEIYKN